MADTDNTPLTPPIEPILARLYDAYPEARTTAEQPAENGSERRDGHAPTNEVDVGHDDVLAGEADYAYIDEEEGDDILGALIAMVLTQSTSNENSARSFANLLDRFRGDWHRIATAPVDAVIDAIRVGGLARQKAPRIQGILEKTHEERGEYSLEWLREAPLDEARRWLEALPGVGPHTAAFVLMRAARRPIFAMDSGILRVAKRLGWVPEKASSRRAHRLMQPHIPDGEHDAAHVALIRHARRTCTRRDPACTECVLAQWCAYHLRPRI